MTTHPTDRIRLATLLAYAAPAFALAVVGIPIYVYIPKFYTDVIGVNISIMGGLIAGVRIFDAVTDPVLGFLSDRINAHPSRIFGSEFSKGAGMHTQHRDPQPGDVHGHDLLSFDGRPLRAFSGRPDMDVEIGIRASRCFP